jgi:insulysin
VTETIPASKIATWSTPTLNEKLRIPEKNEFIPTDFELAARDSEDTEEGPTILKETSLFRMWFKQVLFIVTVQG